MSGLVGGRLFCVVWCRVTLVVPWSFVACAHVPCCDACGWRGCASRAFSVMGASGACHVDMWGGWCGNVRVGCMRCVAVRRVAMGARAVVPLRCVVVLVTPSRHGCHGVRGRELIVLRCLILVCFVTFHGRRAPREHIKDQLVKRFVWYAGLSL